MATCNCGEVASATGPSSDLGHIDEARVLNEDFQCMKRVAEGICHTLARPKDRTYCRETLDNLSKFNEIEQLDPKRDVNRFLRFYLKVLRNSQIYQPVKLYKQWYGTADCDDVVADVATKDGSQLYVGTDGRTTSNDDVLRETRIWLEENRSYLAMITYRDGSTLIYVAVAKLPSAGWVHGGLKSLRRQPECAASSTFEESDSN